jgi:uncharacterized protein
VKLHASAPGRANTFTGYGADYVMVNGERRDSSVVVMADRIEPWRPDAFERLSSEDFAFLLGTGPRQRFPHPRLTRALAEARIGLEIMDLQAACRTYNILVAEERKVAAALLFE